MIVSTKSAQTVDSRVDLAQPVSEGALFVDAHVHFHDAFNLDRFLGAARRNIAAGARQAGEPAVAAGCLLMTESAGTNYFWKWMRQARESGSGAFALTAEDCSLFVPPPCHGPGPSAHRRTSVAGCVAPGPMSNDKTAASIYGVTDQDDVALYVIAGRQIVCSENLEVLALMTSSQFPELRPIRETIRAVLDAGALAVLPWGFGKWSGGRGRVIREIIDTTRPDRVFLGDNGGRLVMGQRPALFAHGESLGWMTLPGSDPLPMKAQAVRAGSYGCVLRGAFDPHRPASSIRTMLMGLPRTPRTFGQLEGLGGFIRSQIAMQWRKRFQKSPTNYSRENAAAI